MLFRSQATSLAALHLQLPSRISGVGSDLYIDHDAPVIKPEGRRFLHDPRISNDGCVSLPPTTATLPLTFNHFSVRRPRSRDIPKHIPGPTVRGAPVPRTLPKPKNQATRLQVARLHCSRARRLVREHLVILHIRWRDQLGVSSFLHPRHLH